MGLYKKLQLYRTLLQIFLGLNAFVLVAGTIAAFNFFAHYYEQKSFISNSLQQIEKIEKINEQLFELVTITGDSIESNYQKRQLSEAIVKSLPLVLLQDRPENIELVETRSGPRLTNEQIRLLKSKLVPRLAALQENLRVATTETNRVDWWIIITAGLTLLIGVIIPALLFHHLVQLWQKARSDLEGRIRQLVQQWFEQYQQTGPDAFAQAAFWLNIVLIGIENVGRKSSHPLWQILAEVSPLIRQELGTKTAKDTKVEI